MKFSLSSRERSAGLFLVGSTLLVIAFIVGAAVRNRWFSPRIAYHTLLFHGDGMRAGSPVLLSGVEVGHVGAITIRDDARVDVELVVLAEHAGHMRQGILAVPRRLLGIGEKRLHLVPAASTGELLPPDVLIPCKEPTELLDLVETIDLGQTVKTANQVLSSLDRNLAHLDENGRLDHLFTLLDRLGPLLDHLDALVTDAGKPLTALLKDPNVLQAIRGTAAFTTDPALHPMLQHAATALDDKRMDKLLSHAQEMFTRLDKLTADDGHLGHLLVTTDKLLGDGRADRLVASLDRLADEKKLGALVDHLGVLAEQMSRVGPEIPALTKDLHTTLREAVIVLKAMQDTWLLSKQSKDARAEMK